MKLELYDLKKNYDMGLCPEIAFEIPGEEDVYKRRFQKPARLIILGGGYVAQALCKFASELEFSVIVSDDRPTFANRLLFPGASEIICDSFENAIAKIDVGQGDYVAVVTRGHRQDADCLRLLLAEEAEMPSYLGMIGSKRRVHKLFEMLREEGYDREKMDEVHSPIGLSIDAVTPEEIGISILAELIQCRRADWKKSEGLLEQTNADSRFLDFLELEEEEVVAVVVERSGSTPVKTGAIMAVDRIGCTYGTVGGGCGEHEVVMKAMQVFRQKRDCTIQVDMSNDIAMNEGMVCGGRMKLALYYIPARKSSVEAISNDQRQIV